MKWTWTSLTLMAAVLAVVAACGGAAAAAQTQTRVEASSADGAKPEIHVWINGQEVTVGQPAEAVPGTPGEAYLGVMATPLAGKARDEIEAHAGVMVTTVVPGSPAAKAGIEAGDVIAEIGGTAMENPQQLVAQVRQYKPGASVKIVFFREGKRMEKTVTLGVRPGSAPEILPLVPKEAPTAEAYLGVVSEPLSKEVAAIAGTERGVLIKSLPDESPAAKASLQPGDVIVSVGGQDVGSPEDLVRIVGSHKPGDAVKVVYFRSGKKASAEVKLGTRPVAAGQPEVRGLFGGEAGELLQRMPATASVPR